MWVPKWLLGLGLIVLLSTDVDAAFQSSGQPNLDKQLAGIENAINTDKNSPVATQYVATRTLDDFRTGCGLTFHGQDSRISNLFNYVPVVAPNATAETCESGESENGLCVYNRTAYLRARYQQGIVLMCSGELYRAAFSVFLHARNIFHQHSVCYGEGERVELPNRYESMYGLFVSKSISRLMRKGELVKPNITHHCLNRVENSDKFQTIISNAMNAPIAKDLDSTDRTNYLFQTADIREILQEDIDASGGEWEAVRTARFLSGCGNSGMWRFYSLPGAIRHFDQNCCASPCFAANGLTASGSVTVDNCCHNCNRYACPGLTNEAKLATAMAGTLLSPASDIGLETIFSLVV